MTKKDYKILADVFKKTQPEDDFPYETRQWEKMLLMLSAALSRDNDRFEHDKFEDACYNERI